jgi:hypothetical protein
VSLGQQFVEYLVLDDIEQIPCNCPACRPTRPEDVTDTREFDCLRMKALFEAMRRYRELIALSRQGPTPASSEGPPSPKELP